MTARPVSIRWISEAATLGDPHRAIQVLFGWDGDYLPALAVAGKSWDAAGEC